MVEKHVVNLFLFEPGDGYSYRIFFGRLPGRGLVAQYTLFGIAVGSSDPGPWFAFNTDSVDFDSGAVNTTGAIRPSGARRNERVRCTWHR